MIWNGLELPEAYYQGESVYIIHDDCRDILPSIRGVSAIVTDPPYELGFMGKAWDSKGISFQKETWQIIKQSCLSGSILLSFGGTRTSHRIAVAIEDAGWEIRDMIMWVYGSGFPKSLDISKAIDKQSGAARELIGYGQKGRNLTRNGHKGDMAIDEVHQEGIRPQITTPSSPEAKLWEGYGTALKPAYEPIILAMNPMEKTFANNALKHGVAGLNIDKCRVPLNGEHNPLGSAKRVFVSNQYTKDKIYGDNKITPNNGRFPANFIHDGSQEVMDLFPNTGKSSGGKSGHTGAYGGGYKEEYYDGEKPGFGDKGSAARFFYCAKASRSERDMGCEAEEYGYRANGFSANISDSKLPRGNTHPTVKPLALMTYLCKLVKMPKYNLILDPFCGSGTTLLACIKLGIPCIGIDSDEKSCEIAAKRLSQSMMRLDI